MLPFIYKPKYLYSDSGNINTAIDPTQILEEGFKTPENSVEFYELIEACIYHYKKFVGSRKDKAEYRDKINSMIEQYNKRRGFKCFVPIH